LTLKKGLDRPGQFEQFSAEKMRRTDPIRFFASHGGPVSGGRNDVKLVAKSNTTSGHETSSDAIDKRTILPVGTCITLPLIGTREKDVTITPSYCFPGVFLNY